MAGQMKRKPRGQWGYKTIDFQNDIAAFLGNARVAPRLWHFIRRQIAQELLDARTVYIADIGTFFFKLRPGRIGPTKWEDDRLIIKFKVAPKFQKQFHESQKRGRGKALLETLKKVPRIRNSALEYKRVAKRKPTWYTAFGAKLTPPPEDQLRQPGSDNALAQPPIPSSSAGQDESTKAL